MQGVPTQKDKIIAFLAGVFVGLVILAFAMFQIPFVKDRISWRIDFAMAFVRGIVDPVRPMPTAAVSVAGTPFEVPGIFSTPSPAATVFATAGFETTPVASLPASTATPTTTPVVTPTAIPEQVELPAPAYEKQEVNNCGPATLAMHLRFFGWEGDQNTISSLLKPLREDRNVNVEELVSYVNTEVPGLEIQYRVGGDVEILKQLIAAGFPVTIEEGFIMEESYWFNDDRWAGHYLLLTGYNDAAKRFTAQDVFVAPNISVPYEVLERNWKAFNRVYMVVYPLESRETVQAILGKHWDVNANRQYALERSQQETEADPTDSYAWFNLGTNLVYFEKYSQAAIAYDHARNAGLPQRMLRYQFGPFFAYFHTNRIEDLLALTDYALDRTPNSEEAMLWRGWALYRQQKKVEALELFAKALEARPGYTDALYALDFVRNN